MSLITYLIIESNIQRVESAKLKVQLVKPKITKLITFIKRRDRQKYIGGVQKEWFNWMLKCRQIKSIHYWENNTPPLLGRNRYERRQMVCGFHTHQRLGICLFWQLNDIWGVVPTPPKISGTTKGMTIKFLPDVGIH